MHGLVFKRSIHYWQDPPRLCNQSVYKNLISRFAGTVIDGVCRGNRAQRGVEGEWGPVPEQNVYVDLFLVHRRMEEAPEEPPHKLPMRPLKEPI